MNLILLPVLLLYFLQQRNNLIQSIEEINDKGDAYSPKNRAIKRASIPVTSIISKLLPIHPFPKFHCVIGKEGHMAHLAVVLGF